MPCAKELAGKNARKIETVEARRICPVVRNAATDHDLREEEQTDHHEELNRSALALGRLMGQHCWPALIVGMPTEEIKTAEGEQHHSDAAEQHQQTHCAPQNRAAGRDVTGQRVIGEIVGVGVGLSGPPRSARPGGPGEEGGQFVELIGIPDQTGGETAIVTGSGESIPPRAPGWRGNESA